MPPPAEPVVTLYGRPGCHLCDAAEAILRTLEPELGFSTALVNIEADDALHRRFMFEIPVVEVDGQVIARAPIARRALVAALKDALRPG